MLLIAGYGTRERAAAPWIAPDPPLGAIVMVTSIRLDLATEQRLDKLAARTGRTKAYYLRELVAQVKADLGLDG
jgi:Ribbon-helix-helix protein, copG family